MEQDKEKLPPWVQAYDSLVQLYGKNRAEEIINEQGIKNGVPVALLGEWERLKKEKPQ